MQRSDKGKTHNCKRNKDDGLQSEGAWIKRRRLQVQAGVQAGIVVQRTAADLHWTATHAKELAFQRQKQAENEVQAYQQGHLLPAEIPEDMLERNTLSQIKEAERWLALDKNIKNNIYNG